MVMSARYPIALPPPCAAASQRALYEAQAERIAVLLAEMEQAFAAEDFGRLAHLGNRLATDSVIARALKHRGLERDDAG